MKYVEHTKKTKFEVIELMVQENLDPRRFMAKINLGLLNVVSGYISEKINLTSFLSKIGTSFAQVV